MRQPLLSSSSGNFDDKKSFEMRDAASSGDEYVTIEVRLQLSFCARLDFHFRLELKFDVVNYVCATYAACNINFCFTANLEL